MSKKAWLTLMFLVSILSVVLWNARSHAAPASDRWEYKITVLNVVVGGQPRQAITTVGMEKMLSAEGRQGWELAAIDESQVQCETVSVWVYLKRKL